MPSCLAIYGNYFAKQCGARQLSNVYMTGRIHRFPSGTVSLWGLLGTRSPSKHSSFFFFLSVLSVIRFLVMYSTLTYTIPHLPSCRQGNPMPCSPFSFTLIRFAFHLHVMAAGLGQHVTKSAFVIVLPSTLEKNQPHISESISSPKFYQPSHDVGHHSSLKYHSTIFRAKRQ